MKLDLRTTTGNAIVFAFLFNVIGLFFVPIPSENKEAFHITLGMVDGAFVGGLVGYFFGAIHKDENPPPQI